MSPTTSDSGASTLVGRWATGFESLVHHRPWPGTRPLRQDEGSLLGGRADDITRWAKLVKDNSLLIMAARSGVGKTSFLRAGLIPQLSKAGFTVGLCRRWGIPADDGSHKDPVLRVLEFIAGEVFAGGDGLTGVPTSSSGSDNASADPASEAEDLGRKLDALLTGAHPDCGPGRFVLVLDQFEEIIRFSPEHAEAIFALIEKVNHATESHVLISLREEHTGPLLDLQPRLRPFSFLADSLREIPPDKVKDVVTCVNSADRTVVADGAATEAVALWNRAKQHRTLESVSVGTLHLQAFLTVLADRAGTAEEITIEPVRTLATELHGSPVEAAHGLDPAAAYDVFQAALDAAADADLLICRRACGDYRLDGGEGIELRLDESFIDGTEAALVGLVGHLSSAGFKLDRDLRDLIESALGSDLALLRSGVRAARGAIKGLDPKTEAGEAARQFDRSEWEEDGEIQPDAPLDLVMRFLAGSSDPPAAETADLLGESPQRIAESLGWGDRLHLTAQLRPMKGGESVASTDKVAAYPSARDFREVTSGAVLGQAPIVALIEELRRFAFALLWLQKAEIVRTMSSAPGRLSVTLVHDAYGAALERWRQRRSVPESIRATVAAVAAPKGVELLWEDDEFRWAPSGGGGAAARCDKFGRPEPEADEPRELVVLANLRWRGAAVVATAFERVAFVNCDFRGSVFQQCSFNGVVFVNCLLDGAMISDSTVIGFPEQCGVNGTTRVPWTKRPPQFVLVPRSGAGGEPDRRDERVLRDAAHLIHQYENPGHDRRGCAGIDVQRGEILTVFSPRPGQPATAGTQASKPKLEWEDEAAQQLKDDVVVGLTCPSGGLSVFGGRISTLAVRRLKFEDKGLMLLHNTAGSGLDVVEHEHPGTYVVSASSLRHSTFTSSPVETSKRDARSVDGGSDEVTDVINLVVTNSVMFTTWIGEDLTGKVLADESLFVGLWNASPGVALSFDASCRVDGVTGFKESVEASGQVPGLIVRDAADVSDAADSSLGTSWATDITTLDRVWHNGSTPGAHNELLDLARKTDYRRFPDQDERLRAADEADDTH